MRCGTTRHRAAINQLEGRIDTSGALEVWEAAVGSPLWTGPDVWVHGDMMAANLIVRDDRLCGVIDFGCSAIGDPACDLTPRVDDLRGIESHAFHAVGPSRPWRMGASTRVGALEGSSRSPDAARRRPAQRRHAFRLALDRNRRRRPDHHRVPRRRVRRHRHGPSLRPGRKLSAVPPQLALLS